MTSYEQAHVAMLLFLLGFGGFVLLPWVLDLVAQLVSLFP
jgi:hypothetical protein